MNLRQENESRITIGSDGGGSDVHQADVEEAIRLQWSYWGLGSK